MDFSFVKSLSRTTASCFKLCLTFHLKLFLILVLLALHGCNGENGNIQQTVSEKSDSIVIFKDRGAIQCESSGMSTTESANILTTNGIDVMSSECGFNTNIAVLTVCGAGTTEILIHKVRASNIIDVEALGYKSIQTLENEAGDPGYIVTECPVVLHTD